MRFFCGFFKSKKFYAIIFILAVSFVFGKYTLDFVLFPDEIHIIAGKENSFDFNVPVAATISKKDKAVVNINNQELEQSVSVDLGEPLYVWSDSECTMDMSLSFMGIPMKDVKVSVLPHLKVIPCGKTVGVRIDTDGIMVLGLGKVETFDGKEYIPCDGKIFAGDILTKADGHELLDKEELISVIENSENGIIHFEGRRDDEFFSADVSAVCDKESGKNKIGVWVRDSTQGIGTITYIDKETGKFAALGHGIVDVDTKKIMEVKSGDIMKSEVISINKGEKGSPGELLGKIQKDEVVGKIFSNNNVGIYGTCDVGFFDGEEMPVAFQNEVVEGRAYILANVEGNNIDKFDVYIESVNRYNRDNSKGMLVKIIDKRLLEKTNGIVQGMSGSPIIQNGKLVGAVTHVLVNDPTRGYGIFIENMIERN